MNAFWEGLVTIAVAVVMLGVVATLVSKNAQTPAVFTAATGGFAKDLAAAEGPVLGGSGGIGVQTGTYATNSYGSGFGG
ncbi:MAG TPA: hypothetical protein VGG68_09285 [Caulobacteraceae bacterium]|jgi:hypothetical protein